MDSNYKMHIFAKQKLSDILQLKTKANQIVMPNPRTVLHPKMAYSTTVSTTTTVSTITTRQLRTILNDALDHSLGPNNLTILPQ